MRKKLNNKGLTLIEIIVTLAVLGVVVTPLMSMFITSQKINTESEKEYAAIQLTQKYMEELKSMDVLDTDNFDGYSYDSVKNAYIREVSDNEYDLFIQVKKVGTESGTIGLTNPADGINDFSILSIKQSTVNWNDGYSFVNKGNGYVDITITDANKPNIKVLLNTNANLTVYNERSDKVSLYIYNIVNNLEYDCNINLKKGQINTIYNNYTAEEDNIESINKTAKNILYEIVITVQKDGKQIIDEIVGTTIFKYEPIIG